MFGVSTVSQNVTWHPSLITRSERFNATGQTGATVWFTGLPSSGKSTLAMAVQARLTALGRCASVLDGDNLRHGLCADLGFSVDDRDENIRRAGEVACLLADAGVVSLVALVSPYIESRRRVRELHERAGLAFIEVFIDTPAEECARRDPKGLWARARAGDIPNFTGVSDTYEPPLAAELKLPATMSLEAAQVAVLDALQAGSEQSLIHAANAE